MKGSEKKEIIVTISGVTGVGKSHVMYLLHEFFNSIYWEAELQVNSDYKNKSEFKEKMSDSINEVLPILMGSRKIVLREAQNNRMLDVDKQNW